MKVGDLYQVGRRGATHVVIETKALGETREIADRLGVTACGKVVDPCVTDNDFRGRATALPIEYEDDAQWVTCKRCAADPRVCRLPAARPRRSR